METGSNKIEGLARTDSGELPINPAFKAVISVPFDLKAQRVTMHVLSDEKVEQLISAGSPWPLAMFTLTGGVAAGILIALYSGGVVVDLRNTFWVAFWAMLIMAMFFGGSALYDSRKTNRIKRAIKDQSKTVVTLPTVEVHSTESPLG